MVGQQSNVAEPSEEGLWREANSALKSGDEARAIRALTKLADEGDWRAATSLGYIYESHGKSDRTQYVRAAHWYTNALSKEDHPLPRLGLARYYYFGLAGEHDFQRAFEHLKRSLPAQHPEAALMLGELLFVGAGVVRDIEQAEEWFLLAANAGYPSGYVGLSRVARAKGQVVRCLGLAWKAFALAARLRWKDAADKRLFGLGRRGGRFTLEGVVTKH